MERIRIETDQAPPSTGFRSRGLQAGGFLFVSGQIGAPLATEGAAHVPSPTLVEQVDLCLRHLEQVTLAADASPARVVEASIFLVEGHDEAIVRERITRFLGYAPPLVNSRRVADVALHAMLELDWIVLTDPALTPEAGAAILALIGHGDGVARSGPFVFLNGLSAPGQTLGEQTTNLLLLADRRLRDAGSSLRQVVRLTVFIADFDSYPQFNEATKHAFADIIPPARSVVVAPAITGDALLRVDLIALAGKEAS